MHRRDAEGAEKCWKRVATDLHGAEHGLKCEGGQRLHRSDRECVEPCGFVAKFQSTGRRINQNIPFCLLRTGLAMGIQLAAEQTITVGGQFVVEGPSPSQPFGVVFEDDGRTGYLYGLDFAAGANPIVDALHIYNVEQVTDREKPSKVQLFWSSDGLKAALLINGYPHAIFDFAAKRGYCRTGFPPPMEKGFSKEGHAWSDAAEELFR